MKQQFVKEFLSIKKEPHDLCGHAVHGMVLVETVGHVNPSFRIGTDYILNLRLLSSPLAYYEAYKFVRD
jgi:hypothetical protein